MTDRVVIVGAGQGGYQCAASLRDEGFEGEILLLGDEPELPYQRPPLSKQFIKDGDAERLLLKPQVYYERQRITLRMGMAVARIDREAKEAVGADGERFAYDHLVLATGARNRRPPIPGLTGDVAELRSVRHAARVRNILAGCRTSIVIGGGFIGLEFSAMARAQDVAVTVVEAAPRLMSRALSARMSEFFLGEHGRLGTSVLLGRAVAGVHSRDGHVIGVDLSDGSSLGADIVLVAAGVQPNVELAAEAGLEVGNGIVVDGRLLTSDPSVSALGDCAFFPFTDGRRVRLESVQCAVDQARHIARRIARGSEDAYASVPWFWSDQGSLKLQIAGLRSETDEEVLVEQPNGTPAVFLFGDGVLTAVETVNAPGIHVAARRKLGATREQVEQAGFDLKAIR